MVRPVFLIALIALGSCGPSFEDHVARLDSGGDEQVNARQELMLARDQAIAPLLEALEDPRYTSSHPEMIEMFVDLMMRIEDERIVPALKRHLLTNPDAQVRARICEAMGLYKRPELVDEYMVALHDSSSVVRARALVALRWFESRLSESQKDSLIATAWRVPDDDNLDTRLIAAALIAHRTNEWLIEGGKLKLKGQIAEAESLYHEALAFEPESKRAAAALGMLYFDNGQEERGRQVLRESGWLIDVPMLDEGPRIDGRLDDGVWKHAGKLTPFVINSLTRNEDKIATVLSQHKTQVYVFYTKDALYLGARCEDAHPESRIVAGRERDHEEEHMQDLVGFYFHPDFDSKRFVIIIINSTGAVTDSSFPRSFDDRPYDRSWNGVSEKASNPASRKPLLFTLSLSPMPGKLPQPTRRRPCRSYSCC